jgi:cob(I)alamin adenosyltransferase
LKVPVILVAIIAAGSLMQIAFIAVLAWKGLALARGLGEMKKRLRADLGPALDDASRIARNAAALSEMATAQMASAEAAISNAKGKVEEIRETIGYEMDRAAALAGMARTVARRIAALRRRQRGRR